jgi:hypothetical protein
MCTFIGCTFICMMVLKVMASMGQSSDEPFKKPPPLPWPKGKPPPPVKKSPPLPFPNWKPPPPLLPCFVPEGKAPPVLPKRYCVFLPGHVVFLPGPPPPKPPPAVAQQQPPQQPAVAYAAAAAAAASEEQADAGNADEAATCEEQTSSVEAPPFKKPPPPLPPFAQLPRWAQLNTIRCVAYAAAAAAAASEEQADAGNADEAATCEEQTSSVEAPPFKKPPPPLPPFAQLPRWAQLNTIRCVAYAAAAAAAASEEQADAGNADEAATCEEQTSSVKAPPFKKPPPPPPPFAQLPRWAQLNTIRCQCSCGLLRRDACEKRVCLPRRLCAECMDIAYIRTNMGAVCRCRCRECK